MDPKDNLMSFIFIKMVRSQNIHNILFKITANSDPSPKNIYLKEFNRILILKNLFLNLGFIV